MDKENKGNIAPIEKGQKLVSKCISIGKKGDGICKHKNFVIIVPEAKEGKCYEIEVTRVLNKVSFAEIVREAEESEVTEE